MEREGGTDETWSLIPSVLKPNIYRNGFLYFVSRPPHCEHIMYDLVNNDHSPNSIIFIS